MSETQKKKSEKTKKFTSEFGNEYVFQRVGAAKWLDIMDDAEDNGNPKRKKLYPAILDSVVVQPGNLKPEDFDGDEYDGSAELEEVVSAALRFQRGK